MNRPSSDARPQPTCRSPYQQRGQTTVVIVILSAVLLMLGGLAYDGAQILNARRRASALAIEAARAGAQAVSTELLYQDPDDLSVDPTQARIAVSGFLDQQAEWSMSVSGDTVATTVWLTQPLHMLSMLGIDSRRVTATATARAVRGIKAGDDL